MLKTVNSSVMIRDSAIDGLNALCRYHKISKVDLTSFVIAYLVTLHPDEIDEIISQGKVISTILNLGGRIDYPRGIEVTNGHIRKILEGVK